MRVARAAGHAPERARPEERARRADADPSEDPTGFGFLDCPPTKEYFGRDIYVHKDLAVTMTPGETYRFNAYLNRDNMPNASEAEPCEPEWEPIPTDLTEFRRVEAPLRRARAQAGARMCVRVRSCVHV